MEMDAEVNEIENVAEHIDKAAYNVGKDAVRSVVHRVVSMKEFFGGNTADDSEKALKLADLMTGDKVTLDMSGVTNISPEVMLDICELCKDKGVEFRNFSYNSETGVNESALHDVAKSNVHTSITTDFSTKIIDLNAFMGGEDSVDSRESIQNLNKIIIGIKENEPEVDEIIVDFSHIKHISYEAAEELQIITDKEKTIKFSGFTHDKIDMERSESITSKIEPDGKHGLSPEEDAIFLKEVENAEKLSYAQSRMLAIVHPELIDKYSEKFDWENASKCVAKYCPKAVLTNEEKFNFWDASDMLVKTDAEVAEKVKDKLNPGKNRQIKMNDEVHPDQIRLMAEKGERLGLSAVCVERLKNAYQSHESLSGQKFLELLSKDLYRPENFNLQRVPVDNDIVKAMAIMNEAGLQIDERTIRKIRINENQYMKIPSHDLGFSDIKSQLPSLLRGERSALMHGVDDNGVMKDYKLQIGYDAKTGNLQIKKLDKNQKLEKPEGMRQEDWEKLSNGVAGVVQSRDPIEGFSNGFKAGQALADLLFNYSIDRELNRVIATVDIPYNSIKENQNINVLQSLNEGVEQQIREERKNNEKIDKEKTQGESVETAETESLTSVSVTDSSDVDSRLAEAEKEVAWLANETVTENSAEAEARLHMDLGRLEELHDKEFRALGHGEEKLSNLQAEKNSQRQKISSKNTVRKQNKVKLS